MQLHAVYAGLPLNRPTRDVGTALHIETGAATPPTGSRGAYPSGPNAPMRLRSLPISRARSPTGSLATHASTAASLRRRPRSRPRHIGRAFENERSGQLHDSYVRRVRALPEPTQRLMLLAAADPTGNATLLWRAAQTAG